MNSSLQIRTPEGILFSQPLAGPFARMFAWVIDAMCISALTTALWLASIPLLALSPNMMTALGFIGYFVITISYAILLEWFWRGQTIGKRMLRLRVVDAEGLRLQFNQVVTRNLLRFVDSLPLFYFVGGVVCWFSPKLQRLGDLAANTVVARQPRLAAPDVSRLVAGKFNSLRQHPTLVARLRQRVTPGEASIIVQAMVRRDSFAPAARVELFAELAEYFKSKVEFPPEAMDGIADEQFLINLVDVLYRTKAEPVAATAPVAAVVR